MKIDELNTLIVEDDDFQREMLVNLFRSLGMSSISGAENGRQALELLRRADSRPFDIVLCDLNMPQMDGMEFLRHMGEEHYNTAVIISSAMDGKLLSSVGKMTRMYGIRLLGTIEKPVLLGKLREILSKYGNVADKFGKAAQNSYTLDEILSGIRASQLEPYFQPKVDLKSGKITGAEALVRWMHPVHGVIGPDAFIPTLEKNGKLDELTFFMLERSAAACRSLHERGHLLTISVNLSLSSLDDTTLADRVHHVVRSAGIDPQYIVLEITESAAMTTVAPALENLARLCMNGFSLSIDDYGTGYSSLQQLTRIAFNELKIDQSFVRDLADNESSRIVVESSIDMARKLQVKTVAEGVETQQDWDTLRRIGCNTVQGYLIARPMNIAAFGEFLAGYRAIDMVSPTESHKPNVLVVDDDDFTRRLIIRVLRDAGFDDVAEADSAICAIKLFEARQFDLIITDIDMPEMNGLQFARQIRSGKTDARRETRIVVLTAYSQMEILGAALALDINGFLVKPIVPAVVEEKLAQAMRESLYLRAPIAYESVRTELNELPGKHRERGASITLNSDRGGDYAVHQLPLPRLRPGMVLKECVYLKDGALLLSPGHVFSELSINRLKDLSTMLQNSAVAAAG